MTTDAFPPPVVLLRRWLSSWATCWHVRSTFSCWQSLATAASTRALGPAGIRACGLSMYVPDAQLSSTHDPNSQNALCLQSWLSCGRWAPQAAAWLSPSFPCLAVAVTAANVLYHHDVGGGKAIGLPLALWAACMTLSIVVYNVEKDREQGGLGICRVLERHAIIQEVSLNSVLTQHILDYTGVRHLYIWHLCR